MKKSNIYKIVLIAVLVSMVAISSCLKDITVEIPQADSCLVVDGYIDLDDRPIVFLSSSMAYFTELDTNTVNNLQITDADATVIVSDGITIDTLQYLPIQRWPYKCFQGTKILGQIGRTYDLTIKYKGDKYTSFTTIPDTVTIDTVMATFFTDTFALMKVNWKDPKNIPNYYSIHVKNQYQPMYYRPYALCHIAYDDDMDGKEMAFAMVVKGLERNTYYNDFFTKEQEDSAIYKLGDIFCFSVGDSVSLKLSTIDQVTYHVWESWYRNWLSDGNPFMNPATVKTNIEAPEGKTARGFWTGYGASYKSVYLYSKDTVLPIGEF